MIKKTFTVLISVLMAAMLFISCNDDAAGSSNKTTYLVSFRLGESSSTGSAFDAQEIVEGEKAEKPDTNPVPSDKYKIFKYWSADNGATEFKFNETPITKDVVLQAYYRDYEVGDTGPAGGKIFYVAASEQSSTYNNNESITWRCLEAAPADISGTIQWGKDNVGTSWAEAMSTEEGIGKGWSNTKRLVNYFDAAEACRSYGDNTNYDDWFLPSKDELAKMYEKRTDIGGFDCTSAGIYWSSSESNSSTEALATRFSDGTTTAYYRYTSSGSVCKVRPIRAF